MGLQFIQSNKHYSKIDTLFSFHSESSSGQSGDLRLSMVSSGTEGVFMTLCWETKRWTERK